MAVLRNGISGDLRDKLGQTRFRTADWRPDPLNPRRDIRDRQTSYDSPGAFGPPSIPDRRKSGGIRTMDYSPLDQAWDAYYKSQRNTPSSSSSSMAFGVRGRASAVPQVGATLNGSMIPQEGAPLNDSMQTDVQPVSGSITDPVNRFRRGRLMKMPSSIRF